MHKTLMLTMKMLQQVKMVVAKLVLRMNLMTMMMSLRRLMAFGLSALDLMELLLKETTLTL